MAQRQYTPDALERASATASPEAVTETRLMHWPAYVAGELKMAAEARPMSRVLTYGTLASAAQGLI